MAWKSPKAKTSSSGGLSLKARAIALLARREHSRQELAQKLAAHGEPAELSAVLDELQAGNWQSDGRFSAAWVQRSAKRHGARRILHDLRAKGIADASLEDLSAQLQATEDERLKELWQQRFGALPADQREYARQYRFLAGRGFAPGAIARMLAGRWQPEDQDSC